MMSLVAGALAQDRPGPPLQVYEDCRGRKGGHNTNFLTRIAHNLLTILDAGRKAQLLALGSQQQADIRRFADMRLPR